MSSNSGKFIPAFAWLIAISMAVLAGYLMWKQFSPLHQPPLCHLAVACCAIAHPSRTAGVCAMPPLVSIQPQLALVRKAEAAHDHPGATSTEC